jgi:hypothetical protein
MTTKEQADIRRKLKILNHGKESGNIVLIEVVSLSQDLPAVTSFDKSQTR